MSKIEQYIKGGLEQSLYTAACISILHGEDVVLKKAFGLLDPRISENKTQINSLFDLASLTKIFIATAFMKLVESSAVDLDDPLVKMIPSFCGDTKNEVTFRHLLSHSSGLPPTVDLYANHEWDKGKDYVINKMISEKLVYQPGTMVVYSDIGYIILGHAMEVMTGKRLDQVLNDALLDPLNWKDVYYKPGIGDSKRIAVTAYTRENRGILRPGVVHDGKAIALDGGIAGHAGLFGTVEAVSKLGEMFFRGTILREQTLSEMIRVQACYNNLRRGLGWQLYSPGGDDVSGALSETSYGHNGFTGTSLWVDPGNRLVITFLANNVFFYNSKSDSEKFKDFRAGLHKIIVNETKKQLNR
ncbi:MAG: serine hydrolase domain-containing protein [bacterium]|nr:serine hydrolase domain-containing protein [bacterium]